MGDYSGKAKAGKHIVKGWAKNKEAFRDDKSLGWSLHPGKNKGDQIKKWFRLHKFKYWFVIPALAFIKKYLRTVSITDEPHNRNFLLFNEVFERSLVDWTMLYMNGNNIHSGSLTANELNKNLNGQSQTILRDMKILMFQFIEKDSAYREFFNILIYNMALYGNEMYNGEKIVHLIYNRETDTDLQYKSFWMGQPSLLHKVRKRWLK